MAASYFFYDLETSGFSPRDARVMQFAGQRSDMQSQPIGDPVNVLIQLSPDVLPDPDAIMLTGITPQQVLSEGVTEAEFLDYFYKEIVTPDTIFLGYNSIRFDDEFMRFLHYRNFYDSYEWQWADGCSRWDVLDLVRMTRALRPEGIVWPVADGGKPTNRLELLTKVNKLDHYKAHDALSDVYATIAIADLIREKQPKLFAHLLDIRKKDKVKAIVDSGQPFMYTSSHFSSEYLHTTAAVLLARHEKQDSAIIYDLRVDPTPFLTMSIDELINRWRWVKDATEPRLPVKTLKYNRCPAIAPGVVQDAASLERLGLSLDAVTKHLKILKASQSEFADKLLKATAKLDMQREQSQPAQSNLTVDGRLYEGFYDKNDKDLLKTVRKTNPEALTALVDRFHDERFQQLLPLYKARNYPNALDSDERAAWDEFRMHKLLDGGNQKSRVTQYFARLGELSQSTTLTDDQTFLLEELQLYGESIVPADVSD
jgi:exodeoxyribonuclease-1